MREILKTMLRDVETETAPMRVLYEARKKMMINERNTQAYQKKARANPHSDEFKPNKPIASLSLTTLMYYWYGGDDEINRVFPINTEGYLK